MTVPGEPLGEPPVVVEHLKHAAHCMILKRVHTLSSRGNAVCPEFSYRMRERIFGFRLSLRGALRGSMGQAAPDGVDGDAFVRGIGAAGPVEGRHPCAACVVQADQSPLFVGHRAAGAAALGR